MNCASSHVKLELHDADTVVEGAIRGIRRSRADQRGSEVVRAAVEGEEGVIYTEDLHQLEDAFSSVTLSDDNKILAADLANVLGALVSIVGMLRRARLLAINVACVGGTHIVCVQRGAWINILHCFPDLVLPPHPPSRPVLSRVVYV